MMKLSVTFLLAFLAISVIKANNLNNKINIIFRYDDFYLKQTVFYDSLFYVFQKNQIPLCIGIIPYDKNGLFDNK